MTKALWISLATSVALFAGSAHAVNDYFIKVDGIPGTSLERGLTDFIQVHSWSMGVNKGQCQALQFVKPLDGSSAAFTGAALTGLVYPNIVLVARKAGERPIIFLKLTLTDSVFTTVKSGGTGGNESVPVEQISARPSSVKTELYELDEKGERVLIATSSVTCPQR